MNKPPEKIYALGVIDGAGTWSSKNLSDFHIEYHLAPVWNFDMATAPKDGTFILVVDKDGDINKVSWESDYPIHTKKWCVYGSWQDEQGGYETIDNPIAWQPLPQPPEKKTGFCSKCGYMHNGIVCTKCGEIPQPPERKIRTIPEWEVLLASEKEEFEHFRRFPQDESEGE